MICGSIPMESVEDGIRFRYWLHRDLGMFGKEGLVFAMLNPSTADSVSDDPTIRRCVAFGRRWGYRELTVVNLFAMRATVPRDMMARGKAAIGSRNDETLRWARSFADLVVAAWGNHGRLLGRDAAALEILEPVKTLGELTGGGCPRHPLYVRTETELLDMPLCDNPRGTTWDARL